MLRRIFNRIRSFFSWLPIIWRDCQSDYSYFYILMRHKLCLMEDFFNVDMCTDPKAKKISTDIKKCVYILDRILKDDYTSEKGYKIENKVFLEVYEKESFMVEQDKRHLFNLLRNKLHTWRK